jgi:hypothetical protein
MNMNNQPPLSLTCCPPPHFQHLKPKKKKKTIHFTVVGTWGWWGFFSFKNCVGGEHELWSLLEFMMTNVFNTCGVDLDQFLGTHNDTIRVVEDKDLITHIKGIIGPFVLKCLKSDLMRQLVLKIQYLFLILSLFLSRSKLDVFLWSQNLGSSLLLKFALKMFNETQR